MLSGVKQVMQAQLEIPPNIVFYPLLFYCLVLFILFYNVHISLSRPYYTMHCFTCVLDVSLAFRMFPRVFTCILDTNMLVSKTRVKTQEKRKKNV